jgi:hypothetical protein
MPAVEPSLTDSHIMCKLNERRKNQFGAPEEFMRRDAKMPIYTGIPLERQLCNRVVAEHGY